MYRQESRIFRVILIIILMVVVLVGLVLAGRSFLKQTIVEQQLDNSAEKQLLRTEVDRSVRMTVRGSIVGDDLFRSYEIEISPTIRRITTYKGYERSVIDNNQFENSTDAYTQFVNALNIAGYTRAVELVGGQSDTNGICAGGRLYHFQILEAQSVEKDFWTTSCRGITGSFRGDASTVRTLYFRQIPNADQITRNLNI